MSKQLKRIKTCNTCGTKHDEVSSFARRDSDLGGWYWECSCGSTMFAPDKKISSEFCDCQDCIENIMGCMRDCVQTKSDHICYECHQNTLDAPYDYEDVSFQYDKQNRSIK